MNIEQKIHRRVGTAIRKHDMIIEGDRVLIAVSGGKDSVTMAKILAEKQRYLPISFELTACQIVTDLMPREHQRESHLDKLFAGFGIPIQHRFVPVLARLDKGRKLNCFFCAMQRRMALLKVANELGCSKIAYGHHLDDIIETLLMNMFYKAEISTMPARLELDYHNVVLIRPLCHAKENELRTYAKRFELVDAGGPECPYGVDGRRQRIKSVIRELAMEDERVRDNLFASLDRVKIDYLREKRRSR